MRGFALSLDLDEHWFVAKNDRHASSLRALNYPALGPGSPHPPSQPGQMRASAHTDYGVLTILKSGGPGLQVFLASNGGRFC
jgi:isopenicillin N synthase-like dioxygenase